MGLVEVLRPIDHLPKPPTAKSSKPLSCLSILLPLVGVPQYIVAALWPQKSLPVNILIRNLQFSDISDLGTIYTIQTLAKN